MPNSKKSEAREEVKQNIAIFEMIIVQVPEINHFPKIE